MTLPQFVQLLLDEEAPEDRLVEPAAYFSTSRGPRRATGADVGLSATIGLWYFVPKADMSVRGKGGASGSPVT